MRFELDGWRLIAKLPDRFGPGRWDAMRIHLGAIAGVTVTDFITDGITQAITDFSYCGHEFTVDTQFGELWLFVRDLACSADVLVEVISLVRRYLDPPSAA